MEVDDAASVPNAPPPSVPSEIKSLSGFLDEFLAACSAAVKAVNTTSSQDGQGDPCQECAKLISTSEGASASLNNVEDREQLYRDSASRWSDRDWLAHKKLGESQQNEDWLEVSHILRANICVFVGEGVYMLIVFLSVLLCVCTCAYTCMCMRVHARCM